ncbi:GumC family protein [Aestuariicoccus sp. MJ-SS9]|uniref:GumC family protein n=1 Tax=Aestuariicoccus sp. MJ-SS9 TaxID=3079855 RepID=UPI00290A95D2|nr:Wzz/FepE/Etk N-terminal domain-containing protein [Aestuariicoccus sp. MJ-SS9]MDU8910813.1 Wzz/FepE/Etk N-terminal domain-containing protein [Aestuariicoccus sp. MJ-SS9]
MNQFQSIDEALAALRRRFWVIVVVTVLGCAGSLYFALNQAKIYEATAVVQIEDARVPDSLAGATAQVSNAARRVRLIEQRLMARDNLMRIMEKHGLFSQDPAITMNEQIFRMRQAARIQEIVNPTQSFQPDATPSGLLITVRLGDPQKAADLANELMASVIEQSRARSASRARDTLTFFEQEAARVETDIVTLEAEIAAFKRDNADALPAGITALRGELTNLRETDLELDQQIVSLEGDSSRARQEVLERRIGLLQEQKALIARRIAAIEASIRAAPEVERDLNALERQLDQLQEQYGVITRRKAEAEMGQMLEDRQQMDRFEVLETALVPENPVSRSRKQIALLGGVASVMAGLFLAAVLELMNPTIRSAAQMERMLGIQPVVAIPPIRTARDRRKRGLKWLAGLAALAALIWAGMRYLSDVVPWQSFGRFLPLQARP